MGWKFYSAIFLALTSSAGSACAQLAPEWKFCDSKGLGTSDERIRSCTVLAESSRESAKNKAVAYFNRGIAWYLKGDNDRAIGDYSDAIRLNPMYASAYNNRCYVRTIIGQVDSALADCDESLRLRANHANTLDTRGFAYLKLGRLDEAIADFSAALSLNQNGATSLYGRGMAKRNKGDAAGGEADMAAAKAIQADVVERIAVYRIK